MGVEHIQGKVNRVERGADGAITKLLLDDGRGVVADLHIDATGFSGLLIEKTLGVPFRSFASNLFNDAAVVMPTPASGTPIAQTESTAMSSGWRWRIPLTNRYGNGYVYSSDFCSADKAETELRSALGTLEKDVAARHLTMRVGQRDEHWSHNCIAIGLSQGFIEPLEATALHIVQVTIEAMIDAYNRLGCTPEARREFNTLTRARFEGVRDYIVCHYKVNSRADTEYWRANASNQRISDSLHSVLGCWGRGEPLVNEIQRQNIGHYYSANSWHCLLAGYGVFPVEESLSNAPPGSELPDLSEIRAFLETCANHFNSHEEDLRLLDRRIIT